MAQIAWITPRGDIGTYAELLEFSFQLEANNPLTSDLTYKVISGSLPPGIQLYPDGLLYGIPNIIDAGDELLRKFKFTVRATNTAGQISDRSFSISINGIAPPALTNPTEFLGYFFDSDYISLSLDYVETNPGTALQWSVSNGQLPLGLTLTQTGTIKGFAEAPPAGGPAGSASYDSTKYDQYVWDFEGATLSRTYKFTIRIYDGILSAERQYSITIFAKSFFRTDNTLILSDNTAFSTDRDGYQYPSVITDPAELTAVRQDRSYAFQLKSYYFNVNQPVYWKIVGSGPALYDMGALPVPDENGNYYELSPFDEKGYDQANLSLPPGLILDKETGWLTGTLNTVAVNKSTYTFTVVAYVEIPVSVTEVSVRASAPVTFSLDILQDIDNYVVWATDADLGNIVNGEVSTLAITAATNKGEALTFKIDSGKYSRLPQGLQLLPSGLISGRTSFDFFSMDRNSIEVTLDDGSSSFDSQYTFTVLAEDATGFVYDTKEFTITVKNVNTKPYENLYIKALLPSALRERFRTTIQNPELVNIDGESVIYRPEDPYFGLSSDIKFLAVPGINAATPLSYIEAMLKYHSNKKINFTDLKLAYAYDDNLNAKYEVVYVEVLDYNDVAASTSSTNISRARAPSITDAGMIDGSELYSFDYGTLNENLYSKEDAGNVTVASSTENVSLTGSNSFGNMTKEIVNNIGYRYQGALPDWMTSIQPDTNTPIGFVRAVVLAYLNPGQGKKLLFRYQSSLTASGFGVTALMNQYAFVADRYMWDRALSINYNVDEGRFTPATTTTFDRIPSIGQVDYGPWNIVNSGTTNNLNAVDYGEGEFIAVGENATIITSRNGELWKPVSQTIDLSYKASLLSAAIAGETEFNFGYGIDFSLGDELLNQGSFVSTSDSFITDIKQLIRTSVPFVGNIATGTTLEFITFTGEVIEQVTQSNIVGNTSVVQLGDDMSNVKAGFGIQIKGIDVKAAANVLINDTVTDTVKLSSNLTAAIPAGISIEFDDLTGNIVSLVTSTSAASGSSNLSFTSSTANVTVGSFARFANVTVGTYVQALYTNVVVDNGTVGALGTGTDMFFTSVISAPSLAGDAVINLSSTDKIGIGSAVIGSAIITSSTTLTAITWPDVTANTTVDITLPTSSITGITPTIGMKVLGYNIPTDNAISAVTVNGTNTIVTTEFNTATFTGNPVITKTATADSALVNSNTATVLALSSTSNVRLNDIVTGGNVALSDQIKVVDIFSNSSVLTNATTASQLISNAEVISFTTPASLDFSTPELVPTGTIVTSKTATHVTISNPLVADLNTGYDSLIKFGLGDVQLNFILYTGSSWLAVGTKGVVLERVSGIWSVTYALPYGDLNCIASDPAGSWVVVGTEGLVARSDDFETWTRIQTGANATLRSIEYYNGTYIAVGDSGFILASFDDGVTWSVDNTVTQRKLTSVKYFNGQWIAVGEKGTVIVSIDALNWDLYSAGVSSTLQDVSFLNNQYIAVGDKGIIVESVDGTKWSLRLSNQSQDILGIANSSNDPVAVGKLGLALVEANSFSVKWAIRGISFEMLNYNSLARMAELGYRLAVGDQLIFAQQEGFDPSRYKGSQFINDGWNDYSELYDSETPSLNYDSGAFDSLSAVPGYLENLMDSTVSNKRAGVWQVALNSNGIAYFEFVRQVQLGQIITIISESQKLVYSPEIKPGNSVPTYIPLHVNVNSSELATTFDKNSTRISEPRDTYLSDPNTHDKYLKFPNTGVLQ